MQLGTPAYWRLSARISPEVTKSHIATTAAILAAGLITGRGATPGRSPTQRSSRARRVRMRDRSSVSPSCGGPEPPSTIDRGRARRRSTSLALPCCRAQRAPPKSKATRATWSIDARFDELQPATRFGPEYLTYVLWAITPEGRAANLGEVQVDDKDAGYSGHHGSAGIWVDCHRRTLFRGHAAERCRRDRKRV